MMSQIANQPGLEALLGNPFGEQAQPPEPQPTGPADLTVSIPDSVITLELPRSGVKVRIDVVKAWNRWIDVCSLPVGEGGDQAERAWNFLKELTGSDNHSRAEAMAVLYGYHDGQRQHVGLEQRAAALKKSICPEPSSADATGSTASA